MRVELRRQFLHMLFGSVFILLVYFLGTWLTFWIVSACLVTGVLISYLIGKGVKFPLFNSLADTVGRDYEKGFAGRGAIFFFLGAAITLALFMHSPWIVIGALVVTVYGDGFAAMIGARMGEREIVKGKSLEGTVAGFVASFIFLSFLFPAHVALAVSFIGMGVELLPIEDNVTIPVACGTALMFLL